MTPASTPRGSHELLPGALDLLILKTLSLSPMHGYGIAKHVQQLSDDVLRVEEGSLYPALQRLQVNGLVRSAWKRSPTGRRARFYELTAAGRRELAAALPRFEQRLIALRTVLGSS